MRLIYVIFKFILFPGTYIRGFWEHLTCKILHLPVESEGYLRADEACGHVEHALATTPWSAWLMGTGPGFMMFNAGMAFLYAGILNIFYLGITPYDSIGMFIFYVILIYLGVSFLCSLFPLTEDILTYWDIAYHTKKRVPVIFKILSFPLALVTRIGAFCEKNCINFILAIVFIVLHIVFLG